MYNVYTYLMYVYMCICICICLCVCVHVYMYLCTCIYVFVYMCISVYVYRHNKERFETQSWDHQFLNFKERARLNIKKLHSLFNASTVYINVFVYRRVSLHKDVYIDTRASI